MKDISIGFFYGKNEYYYYTSEEFKAFGELYYLERET